jgi:acyl-CoA thioester hydrolase
MICPEIPSGCLDGKVHRLGVRVYYEDTDLSGVVYHANYLRWLTWPCALPARRAWMTAS